MNIFFIVLISASLPTCIKTLNESTYEDWKESLEFYLAITNMDLALREEKPTSLTNDSTEVEKALFEKWEHSNRVCLMVMKYTMENSIRQSIPETNDAKEFLKSVGEKFKTSDEAQKCQYLSLFVNTKYDGDIHIREHIMKLMSYYYKLKSLKVELGESTLIWQVLESLPPEFGVLLKTFYNTQKIKWTLDEMLAIVTSHNVQFVSSTLGTKNENKGHKGKLKVAKSFSHLEPKKLFKGNCKYCKSYGHKIDACFLLKR